MYQEEAEQSSIPPSEDEPDEVIVEPDFGPTPRLDRAEAPTSVEAKEREPIIRNYEYKDKDGRLIAAVEARFDPELFNVSVEGDLGDQIRGQKLFSLFLIGPEGKRIDILGLANATKTNIIVATERPSGIYDFYVSDTNTVFTSSLETPLDFAMLLHELGHADQGTRLSPDILKLYSVDQKEEEPISVHSIGDVKEAVDMIVSAIPEAAGVRQAEEFRQLDALNERYSQYFRDRTEREFELKELEQKKKDAVEAWSTEGEWVEKKSESARQAFEKDQRELDSQIKKIRRLIAALKQEEDSVYDGIRALAKVMDIRGILALPRRLMERDAWAVALKKMRQIRKETGADLFAQLEIPKEEQARYGDERGDCMSSTSEGLRMQDKSQVTRSVLDRMRRAVKSHGAGKSWRQFPWEGK